MLRRLALLCLAILPLASACGSRPLLTVGTQRVTVEPNAASSNQRVDISYSVGTLAELTIALVKPDGQQIVVRPPNDRAPDDYSFPFSGVIDVPNSNDKQVLQDGAYKLLFQARAKDGRTAEQTVDAIVKNADPAPLAVDNLSVSLPTFSPNGQGVQLLSDGTTVNQDQTAVNFSVSKIADVSVWVTDAQGTNTPIYSVQVGKAGAQPPFLWDGKGPNGTPVPNGAYTVHVQASDTSGNVTERTSPVTIVDSGTPQVQIVSARFFPNNLVLGGTVNVEVVVKNTGDVPIKTLGPAPGTAYTTQMKGYLDPSFDTPGLTSPYGDTPGRWRVGVRWTSSIGNYPARWGFFADPNRVLQPNEQVTVTGSITVLPPQNHQLNFWATIDMGGLGNTGDYGQTQVIVGFPG